MRVSRYEELYERIGNCPDGTCEIPGTWLGGEKLEPELPKEAHDGSKLRCEYVFIELKY